MFGHATRLKREEKTGCALYPTEHSKPNMYKSGVVDADNGGSAFSNIRTSTGSFLPIGESTHFPVCLLFISLDTPDTRFLYSSKNTVGGREANGLVLTCRHE